MNTKETIVKSLGNTKEDILDRMKKYKNHTLRFSLTMYQNENREFDGMETVNDFIKHDKELNDTLIHEIINAKFEYLIQILEEQDYQNIRTLKNIIRNST